MDSKPRRGDMIIGVIANGKKTPKGDMIVESQNVSSNSSLPDTALILV